MGATTFIDTSRGETAAEAFEAAQADARYEHGHGGYTGTIAEKGGFVVFRPPSGMSARELLNAVERHVHEDDTSTDPLVKRIAKVYEEKWGPAVCVAAGDGEYLFAGFASC